MVLFKYLLFFLWMMMHAEAFSMDRSSQSVSMTNKDYGFFRNESQVGQSRRVAIAKTAAILISPVVSLTPSLANAYTPDPDALRESLYLICRIQEAT